MDNLLSLEETENTLLSMNEFVLMKQKNLTKEDVIPFINAGAQAYKEKIEKLAEPEKLREAIDNILSLLTPYLEKAKQEELEDKE
jgi:hypothetical protein